MRVGGDGEGEEDGRGVGGGREDIRVEGRLLDGM